MGCVLGVYMLVDEWSLCVCVCVCDLRTHLYLTVLVWNWSAVRMYTCISQNTDTEFPESTKVAT